MSTNLGVTSIPPPQAAAAGFAAITGSPSSGAAAAILRRRRVTPPLPKGRTRSRCWPTLLHRGSQRPLHFWMAPAQVAFHRPCPPPPRRRSSRAAPRRMAPMWTLACRSNAGRHFGAAGRHSACPLTADRAAHRPRQRSTRPPILSAAARQSPPRRHIPAAVRRHVWQRDGGRCCYRDPLTGRRCTSSHLLQIDHLLRSPRGVARSRPTSS